MAAIRGTALTLEFRLKYRLPKNCSGSEMSQPSGVKRLSKLLWVCLILAACPSTSQGSEKSVWRRVVLRDLGVSVETPVAFELLDSEIPEAARAWMKRMKGYFAHTGQLVVTISVKEFVSAPQIDGAIELAKRKIKQAVVVERFTVADVIISGRNCKQLTAYCQRGGEPVIWSFIQSISGNSLLTVVFDFPRRSEKSLSIVKRMESSLRLLSGEQDKQPLATEASAESEIKGAFGYKLGELFDSDTEAIESRYRTDGTLLYKCVPRKRFRGFGQCYIGITPTSRKIYTIWGHNSELERGESVEKEEAHVKMLLLNKYAANEKHASIDKTKLDRRSAGQKVHDRMVAMGVIPYEAPFDIRPPEKSYTVIKRQDREIVLAINLYKSNAVLEIRYFDNDLKMLADKESSEIEASKIEIKPQRIDDDAY